MKKIRLRKKSIPSFYFKRIPKQRTDWDKLIETPIILELKDGNFYAGLIDDYEKRIIDIFTCKHLVHKKVGEHYKEKIWKDYDIMAFFPFGDIKNIYCAKDGSLNLEQMLELTINPYRIPVKGIECAWLTDKKHSKNCDEDLHESLAKLYKEGSAHQDSKRKRDELINAFNVVRRFILENNGKIP